MDNLGAEIQRLAGEIRTLEKMLVEAYGLTPVTRRRALSFASLAARVRSWCRQACQRLARNQTRLAWHISRPDEGSDTLAACYAGRDRSPGVGRR